MAATFGMGPPGVEDRQRPVPKTFDSCVVSACAPSPPQVQWPSVDWPTPAPPATVALLPDATAFFAHRAWLVPRGGDCGAGEREFFAVTSHRGPSGRSRAPPPPMRMRISHMWPAVLGHYV